jgi:ribosome-interacting GTPase 1
VISNNDIDRIFEELQRVKITTPRFVIAAKSDIYAKATRADLFISVKSGQDIERLKKEIFERLNVIRIYTKEPGKKPSDRPLVLKTPANVKKLAKHIREDFVDRFDFALIWGPSAKFSGQKVGLEHDLKDKDIVELHLKK